MTEIELYPNLRAENAEVVIAPADRKYGVLMVGAQGTGKTSALISLYLNDCRDLTPRRWCGTSKARSRASHWRRRRRTAANKCGSSTSGARRSG
jgi:hypothetical protein